MSSLVMQVLCGTARHQPGWLVGGRTTIQPSSSAAR